MDETIPRIERHIDRTREQFAAHVRELETRVGAATDWREHVKARPYVALAVAVAGGVLLSHLARSSRGAQPKRVAPTVPGAASTPSMHRTIDATGQVRELWENVANAMIGVAGARLTSYISEFVPGFSEELRRVQARPGQAPRPSALGVGGTSG